MWCEKCIKSDSYEKRANQNKQRTAAAHFRMKLQTTLIRYILVYCFDLNCSFCFFFFFFYYFSMRPFIPVCSFVRSFQFSFQLAILFFDLMMLPSSLETVFGFCFYRSFGTFIAHYFVDTNIGYEIAIAVFVFYYRIQ